MPAGADQTKFPAVSFQSLLTPKIQGRCFQKLNQTPPEIKNCPCNYRAHLPRHQEAHPGVQRSQFNFCWFARYSHTSSFINHHRRSWRREVIPIAGIFEQNKKTPNSKLKQQLRHPILWMPSFDLISPTRILFELELQDR